MPLRLFVGCPRPPTRKKSLTFTHRERVHPPPPAAAPRAHEEQAHDLRQCPKGIFLAQIGLEASERVGPLGVLRPSSPRSEQGAGALRSPLSLTVSGWVRSIPTPSALKWLKSSLERLSEKARRCPRCSP